MTQRTEQKEWPNRCSMFIHTSRTKNRHLSVIKFIPGPAIKRKKALDVKLKILREKDSELRTHIRIGTASLQIWMHHQAQGHFTKYKPMDMNKVDPLRKLQKIKLKDRTVEY